MSVKEKVLVFLKAKGEIPGITEEEKLKCDYLELGIIDSLGIVEMIAEFEQEFGIQFESDHLSSPDFRVVGGLINLIEQMKK